MLKYSEHYRITSKEVDFDFIIWIDEVEAIVNRQIGFNLLDLPDLPYMIRFEDDTTPEEMADEVFSEVYEL